nr:hypothetical protein [Tanacetum cinerariifolium]
MLVVSFCEDNTLHSWILDGNSIHEVPLPSNILGTKIFSDVRSFDVNLLNPMYQARSLKAAVEFFWIGGQKLQKDQESDDENFPGFPNMDLVNWGHNILWSLNQYEHLKKPLVVWDIISALSDLKKSEPNYVGQIIPCQSCGRRGMIHSHYSMPPINLYSREVIPIVSVEKVRSFDVNLLNPMYQASEAKFNNTNGESNKEEPKLWVQLLEMSEKELRERLIGCSFLATINGCKANWQAVGLAQMRRWVANNDCKDYVKILASEVKKIEKRCVAEEECSYCSAPVVFQDTEVAYCQADRCSKDGVTQKHKLERCAVSMTVCPLTPSWFCVSCNRRVSNLAPENLFTLLRYPPTVDSKGRVTLMHNGSSNGEILSKPFCPFCGVLLQRMQPEFLLSTWDMLKAQTCSCVSFCSAETANYLTTSTAGIKILPFEYFCCSNQSIRVTLWGGLGDLLIEKKTKHIGMCPVVVTSTSVKFYNNKLYLSSSSSTMIFDDAEIPALKTLRLYENSGVTPKNASLVVDLSQPRIGTLENLLMGCKKGATQKLAQWWCEACNTTVDYPVLRYRLELDVSDDTGHIVVVLFDELATTLVKCSAESITQADDEIDPTEGIKESIGSSTLDADAGSHTHELKRLSQHLSIPTPLKPSKEGNKIRVDIEDSNTEALGDLGEGDNKGKEARVSDKGKEKVISKSTHNDDGNPSRANIKQGFAVVLAVLITGASQSRQHGKSEP